MSPVTDFETEEERRDRVKASQERSCAIERDMESLSAFVGYAYTLLKNETDPASDAERAALLPLACELAAAARRRVDGPGPTPQSEFGDKLLDLMQKLAPALQPQSPFGLGLPASEPFHSPSFFDNLPYPDTLLKQFYRSSDTVGTPPRSAVVLAQHPVMSRLWIRIHDDESEHLIDWPCDGWIVDVDDR